MQIGYEAFDSDLGRYFRTLPKNVQESIMQSGVVFHTEQDMRAVQSTSCRAEIKSYTKARLFQRAFAMKSL